MTICTLHYIALSFINISSQIVLYFRFSTKIRQLKEGGLINHWIGKEQDKVARRSKDSMGFATFQDNIISD